MRHPLARAWLSPALLTLVLAGCGGGETSSGSTTTGTGGAGGAGGTGGAAPIPTSVINEQTSHKGAVIDEPYTEETATLFRTVDVLPDLDVRSLLLVTSALTNGDLYAGTASGLALLLEDDTQFTAMPVTGTGAVIDLAASDDTHLALARADGVEMWTAPGPGEVWPADAQTVACVALHGADVYVGTENGLSTIDATGLTAVAAAQGFAIRDLAVSGDVVWMATGAGVKRFDAAQNKLLGDLKGAALLADDDVRALAVSSDGIEVLAATATGVSHLKADGSGAVIVPVGKDALPNGDLRAVTESGGVVFTGHGIGATAMSMDHTRTTSWRASRSTRSSATSRTPSAWRSGRRPFWTSTGTRSSSGTPWKSR